jgi:hypothetical protein
MVDPKDMLKIAAGDCDTPLGWNAPVYVDAELDSIPLPLKSGPPPRLPRGYIGRSSVIDHVQFVFLVQSNGEVLGSSVRAISATNGAYVEPAKASLRGARYRPGFRHGKAVAVCSTVVISFEFRLN